ncbi:FecCD family ABC transporter permease [Actinokineospora globicatena]|uniref:FecCD family ABC transporter permease n=1 Tax=Actinokineospora globicatena TaxID=103729 RepID=UPI0020A5FDAD|nr:iron chelate uptake ABC transporter family permease subunit [Actinokineospora globicatena]MCP2305805.1 iron complex transport system permease protein [Actinokineospora globicatena]GLW80339.1 ABC transporter permease [Actinokineospora globicatena]GLW87167.1 ABC transporter permease [Actinokineospora globicatena]
MSVVTGVPVRLGAVSFRAHPRAILVVVGLLLLAAGLALLGLLTGDFPLNLTQLWNTLQGAGTGGQKYIVFDLRLPRVTIAVLVGAALGISGAIFQSLSRNPLGSPDIIGFSTGSATGAILVLVVFGGGMTEIALGSIAGGIVAAIVVYGLAYRTGVQGYRLILIGIGVTAVLGSLNTYVLTRAGLRQAQAAQVWLVGSLNGRGWSEVLPIAISLAVLLPAAVILGRRLAVLEMGDETATMLGIRTEPTRLSLVVISVALTAVATACAGPIAFVALAAPQLARRLAGSSGVALLPAAAMGAALLLGGDVLSQRAFGQNALPVGVTTAAIGGLYLAWLLATEWRSGRR